MKKAIALILSLICALMLTACGNEKDGGIEVYTFSGENAYFSVTNGAIVISDGEEIFSGGELKALRKGVFSDTASFSASFYIVKDGEKRTVLTSSVNDMTGGSVNVTGDLGKISGETVITEGKNLSTEDLVNNLAFELTVTDTKGSEKTYEIYMNVEKVK